MGFRREGLRVTGFCLDSVVVFRCGSTLQSPKSPAPQVESRSEERAMLLEHLSRSPAGFWIKGSRSGSREFSFHLLW